MIGSALRRLREAAGHTQTVLADLVGIKQAQVSAVEVGRRVTTTDVLERWVEICGGVILITPKGHAPDPLTALSPEERAVVEAMRRAQLGRQDAARMAGVAHALGTASGLARDMLEGQVDALVAATRKSSGSDVGEDRRAG